MHRNHIRESRIPQPIWEHCTTIVFNFEAFQICVWPQVIKNNSFPPNIMPTLCLFEFQFIKKILFIQVGFRCFFSFSIKADSMLLLWAGRSHILFCSILFQFLASVLKAKRLPSVLRDKGCLLHLLTIFSPISFKVTVASGFLVLNARRANNYQQALSNRSGSE